MYNLLSHIGSGTRLLHELLVAVCVVSRVEPGFSVLYRVTHHTL